jgi:hypothetical protein
MAMASLLNPILLSVAAAYPQRLRCGEEAYGCSSEEAKLRSLRAGVDHDEDSIVISRPSVNSLT